MEYQKQIKENIKKLIDLGRVAEASELSSQYHNMASDDVEIYSIQAIIAILENRLSDAELILQQGLKIDNNNFDVIYNLAYVYEAREKQQKAYELYLKLSTYQNTNEYHELVIEALQRLQEFAVAETKKSKNKKKIAFFVKQGMDSFLGDVINGLSDDYEIKKVIVDQLGQIDHEMKWADICWFEWCDELVIHGSKLEIAKNKYIVCRIHGYEVYSDLILNANWENINQLIVVAPHILRIFQEKIDKKKLHNTKVDLVLCGVDLALYPFKERKKGYNIGYLGYINFKKNIPLTLDVFYQMYLMDSRYKLYLAGEFQDERTLRYLQFFIKEYQLERSIVFEGWKNPQQKIEWFKKIDYMLISSIDEGLCYAAAEAMASGIKPILHNCEGLKDHYPKQYLFSTQEEAVGMITDENYESLTYRQYIEMELSCKKQISSIKKILHNFNMQTPNDEEENKAVPDILIAVSEKFKQKQTVKNLKHIKDITMIMTTYNRSEVLLADLEKGYKLGLMPKIIVNDHSDAKHTAVIKKLNKKFGIGNIIHHSGNQGLAVAMDTCLKNSPTKNVLSLDDDDILFCLNDDQFVVDMKKINQADCAIIIPRYIMNLDEKNQLQLGYDRIQFNDMLCEDVLKHFFLTGEIAAFNAGAVYNAKKMAECSAEKVFTIGEDHVRLSRFFSSNLKKKIVVSDSYVYVRRINGSTLCGSMNDKKIALHLLTLLVSGYHCLTNDLISRQQAITALRNRGVILQNIYNYGEKITEEIIHYLQGETTLDFANDLFKSSNGKITKFPQEFTAILDCTNKTQVAINKNFSMPKVSIIIPTYNRREYLEESLESVLAQDYKNLEIIVSDNASTDGTNELLEDFSLDKRIKYHRNEENKGFYYNHYNSLYNLATGDYALIMGDDDYFIDSSYISKAVQLLLENPSVVLVHANCKLLDMSTNKIENTNLNTPKVTKGMDYFIYYEQPGYGHICGFVTSLFDRKVAMKLGCLLERSLAFDLLLYLKLMLAGDVGVIDDHVAVYRYHSASTSNNLIPEDDAQTLIELEKVKEMALQRGMYPEVMNQWTTFRVFKYIRWCFISYYTNGKEDIAINLLNSIEKSYPEAYQALRTSLNI
ncbi:glycosyltransferase [Pelosinus sp. sgz500959]|uniref:glycosyltransferase n=1 Tax=Pelosinus sp. sgz500959 TaxID=3242472 RepID=UPI003672608B